MSGIKENKACPACGVPVKNNRTYCSRSCSAKNRVFTKVCTICGEEFVGHFNRQRCRKCIPDKRAELAYRYYGIAQPEYDTMLGEQGGKCALCGEQPATDIDHNHDTGKPRAILCHACNLALVGLEKPQEWRAAAELYLEVYA